MGRDISGVVIVSLVLLLTLLPLPVLTLRSNGKIVVAASIPSLASIVEEVGGNRVSVITILPEGAEPHLFQIRPEIVREVVKAELLVLTGHFEFENKILENVGEDVKVLTLSSEGFYGNYKLEILNLPGDGRNIHGYWLLPRNAILIATSIAEALVEIDPNYKDYYEDNLETFINDVERLESLYASICRENGILGGEAVITLPAEQYIASTLKLKVIGVISSGHGILPTASQLLQLKRELAASNNPFILVSEAAIHQGLGDYVDFLASDIKNVKVLKVRVFSDTLSYLELLSYNLGSISSPKRVVGGCEASGLNMPLIVLSGVLLSISLVQALIILKGRS